MTKTCFLLTALLYFLTTASVQGANAGPDFDPAAPPANFWRDNGRRKDIPLLVKNNGNDMVVDFQETKHYLASGPLTSLQDNLIDTHCKDRAGTKRPHIHYQDNYTAANVPAANAYWDMRFGVAQKVTERIESAGSTQLNCFAYALKNFIGTGTYNYWIDTSPIESTNLDDVMNAETEGKAKKDVATNDILYYKGVRRTPGSYHASGVVEAEGTLQWRFAQSGVYRVY